jgi:hypothetical protein
MAYVPPPELIAEQRIMLCEGGADNEFFKRLIRSRGGLPTFCFSFPPEAKNEEAGTLHGRDNFVNMLKVLNLYFKAYPERIADIEGILLALDAGDDAAQAFDDARKQIVAAGQFGEPKAATEIARNPPHPPITVLVVPPGKHAVGGLETLCINAMSDDFAKELKCVEDFFECCPTDFSKWNSETRHKAWLRCMIAATYEPDPTRSTSTLFAKLRNKQPAIDIEKDCFNTLFEQIRTFCDHVRR